MHNPVTARRDELTAWWVPASGSAQSGDGELEPINEAIVSIDEALA